MVWNVACKVHCKKKQTWLQMSSLHFVVAGGMLSRIPTPTSRIQRCQSQPTHSHQDADPYRPLGLQPEDRMAWDGGESQPESAPYPGSHGGTRAHKQSPVQSGESLSMMSAVPYQLSMFVEEYNALPRCNPSMSSHLLSTVALQTYRSDFLTRQKPICSPMPAVN